MLDGVELKDLKLRWLRSQIGLVSQEPALFGTSIRENLLLGRDSATQVEMEEAARVANAHSFIIKLPDGYDTQVRPSHHQHPFSAPFYPVRAFAITTAYELSHALFPFRFHHPLLPRHIHRFLLCHGLPSSLS
jgi:hypothetical protein